MIVNTVKFRPKLGLNIKICLYGFLKLKCFKFLSLHPLKLKKILPLNPRLMS